jgi:hypothetical protein
MSDISPEDRERLVRSKFKELLHDMFEDEANEWHNKRRQGPPQQQQQQSQQPQGTSQAPERKHSLFEEVLGIGR